MTKVIHTVAEFQLEIAHKKVGAVFTMGALHQGHAALMQKCRELIGKDGLLVVTVFVNPTQFNDPKDLEKYPRDLESDVKLCSENSVDIVFAPSVSEIYPVNEPVKKIDPGKISEILEGESRPGHFAGVATVVNRLLEITKPVVTCFGEKDFQQLAVVKQMVSEFEIAVNVVGVPTVREADGLAMSSRNQRLSKEHREISMHIYEALNRVKRNLQSGMKVSSSIEEVKDWLKSFTEIHLDYLTVLSPELLNPGPGLARVLIAAKIGDVRLIDNIECELGAINV